MLKFHYQSRKLLFLTLADVSILRVLINEYQMFIVIQTRVMLRDFRKAFRKSSNIPSVRIRVSCTKNHLAFVL